MIVWRIFSAGRDPLDGTGAALAGGRWNSPGSPAIYTSVSLALAALERLLYFDPNDAPRDRLRSAEIEVSNEAVEPMDSLPAGWDRYPHPRDTREHGERWLVGRGGSVGILVPSVAFTPSEMNVVLNPRHEHFRQAVRLREELPFAYNPRIG